MRTRRGNNGWLGWGGWRLEGPPRLCSPFLRLNATTAGGNQWKRGGKGVTLPGPSYWRTSNNGLLSFENQGTAFKVSGTIPMTIVVFGVFVLGVNGPIAGECLR